jgi:hypothetical protein
MSSIDLPPQSSRDDLRTASGMATALSSYVITAVLAVLGAQAVVVTFVLDRRTSLDSFYAVSAMATAALIGSVLFGGRGIWELTASGADGHWKIRTSKHLFEKQAVLALFGVTLVIVSAFLGHSKPAG